MQKFNVFFDSADQTVTVFKAGKSESIVSIENVRTPNQAKAALKRRGFTLDADTEDTYPYGTKWDATSR